MTATFKGLGADDLLEHSASVGSSTPTTVMAG